MPPAVTVQNLRKDFRYPKRRRGVLGALTGAFGSYRDLAATILGGELDALLTQPRPVLARDLTDFMILVSSYPGSIYSGASKIIAYTLLPAGLVVLTPVSLLRRPSLATLATEAGAAIAYASLAAAAFHLGLSRYRRGSTPGGAG
jgi:ABC-2 type transport system permease protein